MLLKSIIMSRLVEIIIMIVRMVREAVSGAGFAVVALAHSGIVDVQRKSTMMMKHLAFVL